MKRILLFTCWLLSSSWTGLKAQGTAFVYQGALTQSGSPANGSYDIVFTVYDSPNGSTNVIAGPLTNYAILVNNGLFIIALDFGTGVFNGNPRWLEIGVRTNGASGITTLKGRQAILPSPYAITSANAYNLFGTLPTSNLPPSLRALAQANSSALTNLIPACQEIYDASNSVLGVGTGGVVQWLNAPALDAGNMTNIPASQITGTISVNLSNQNTWIAQSFVSATFIPTNVYFGVTNEETNITVVGSNSTGVFVAYYAPGVAHLKRGDQFNPFWNGSPYVDQQWIVGLTNNGANSDILVAYNLTGNGHSWTTPTNVYVSPAAAQFTDNNGNPGSSIGGDGTFTVWGNQGSLANSGQIVWGDDIYTFHSFVNNDGDGEGVYWTLSGGTDPHFGQFAVCFNAPHKSLDFESSGDVKLWHGGLNVANVGSTVTIQSGNNAKIGTATANGTNSVTVNTAAVTTNSLIFLTEQTPTGVPGAPYVTSTTPGSGFTFKSTSASDSSKVGWWIVEKE